MREQLLNKIENILAKGEKLTTVKTSESICMWDRVNEDDTVKHVFMNLRHLLRPKQEMVQYRHCTGQMHYE